jgi:serine/tyrosine/threonine adenylyltransferase
VTVTAPPQFAFDNTFARELEGFYTPWRPSGAPAPRLLALNDELARELGLDPEALRAPAGVDVLAGNTVPASAAAIAQAYSGHQFGGFSPRLGDGRALLLGELIDTAGHRRDLHLKGSGRTPFARGGDGKAAVGPMLREYVIGEAVHALGIPTSRALAVVATGEDVVRETMLPGAILTRVAASHLRVGTFEYAATQQDDAELVRRLADYAIARHHPEAADAEQPYIALYERIVEAQAALVARWMLVGFIHGVMNTDNMTISGETIDYGPCAFMEGFDPAAVFSSIDQGGRYAYGNQALVAQWNLARLAEAMLTVVPRDASVTVLKSFADRFNVHWGAGMRAKLGLEGEQEDDLRLIDDLLRLLHGEQVDYTSALRALSGAAGQTTTGARYAFEDPVPYDAWIERWKARIAGQDPAGTAAAMNAVNPVYIPRNHLVEEALAAATGGDLVPFEWLVDVVGAPFEERPGLERYAEPAPSDFAAGFRTFCGT